MKDLSATDESRLVIVDVGGLGGIQDCWRNYDGRIKPIVFEPNRPQAEAIRPEIEGRYGGKVLDKALGDKPEKRTLNITKSLGCSSILTPNHEFLKNYSIEPAFDITHQLEVDCVRYDALFAEGHTPQPDVIKVDVQGFEYEVLSGFGQLLNNCLGVQLEAHLYPIYQGQKLLGDLVALLNGFGLSLRRIESVPHFDGDLVEVDAWFTCSPERISALSHEDNTKLSIIHEAWKISSHAPVFGKDQFK